MNMFGAALTSMENLPFKAGQLAEARSFRVGYRGAWFRCKIREITKRKQILGHISEYYDYPDEKLQWTKLYQIPPQCMGNTKEKHRELVLRPHYPPIYNEKQMPNVSEVSEVIVIVSGSWKVGDLVDWWNSDCFWSGRITELFNDEEAQIKLKPPPLGEGLIYKALFKDLRPSLDWSPEHGWTVPSQEGGGSHPCARLIKPINQAIDKTTQVEDTHYAVEDTHVVKRSIGSTSRFPLSSPVFSNSNVSSEGESKNTMEQKDDREKNASDGRGDSNPRKTSRADADSRMIAEQEVEVAKNDSGPKKYKPSEGGAQNSKRSDTLEATILDFEEYINKVKWLKKILKYGISSSDNGSHQWKFVDPHGPSKIP